LIINPSCRKLANVPVNGILPPIVNPAAIPIMFAQYQFGKNALDGFEIIKF
jgi:hypothetical protein